MSRLTAEDSPLPVTSLTLAELAMLPEYSVTVPTGVVVGKKWRRHHPNRRVAQCLAVNDCGHWLLGEYIALNPGVAIQWSRVMVRAEPQFATGRTSSESVLQQLGPRTEFARALRAAAVRHVWTPEED